MHGIGKKSKIPVMLKKRWQRANCRARSMVEGDEARAARIPVAVVPMLEPNVNGYIRSNLRHPTPTNGVKADVKTDELWTRIVIPAPRSKAT